MLAQHSRSSKLAFGPFEFDPESGELFRHGSRVRLASQPGTVLDALVDRPGELVTREDLCNRLWPGATSGDFEHGLNAAVNKLRQTLGDIANQPHYIETLPGVGYRFVAPVHPAGGAVLELVQNPAKSSQGPRLSQQRFAWGVAALCIAMLAWLGVAHWRSIQPAESRHLRLSLLPPPSTSFVPYNFAISPDGRRLAFVAAAQDGGTALWIRSLAAGAAQQLTGTEGAT